MTEGIRIDTMQGASPESAFVRAEGPHASFSEGVEFAVGATVEYAKGSLKPVGVDTTGGKHPLGTLVDHAILARVGGSFSPLHWLSADLSLPFALFETSSPASADKPFQYGPTVVSAPKAPGLGDLRAGVHFRIVDTLPFGFFAGGRFWAPTGSDRTYLSDSTKKFRAEIDLGVAGELSRVLYGCTFNVGPGAFLKRAGDRVAVGCAAHFKATPMLSIGVEPSFALVSEVDANDKSSFAFLIEPLGALRLRLGGVRLGLAAGPSFGRAPGAAEIRGLLSFAYVGGGKPPKPLPVGPSDRDLDKIVDGQDACPDEAGVPSRDPKANGCPARDRDGDGIRDDEDFCPDRAGVHHESPKANGCPDSDNDGMPDPIDECKTEPGPGPSGCPKFARLGTSGFQVNPAIEFGKDEKLTPEGRAALEEIAGTMRANPKLEQVSIGVGTKGAAAKLSDKRAQEILLVLRAGNLDESRYEVVLRDDLRAGSVIVRLVR